MLIIMVSISAVAHRRVAFSRTSTSNIAIFAFGRKAMILVVTSVKGKKK